MDVKGFHIAGAFLDLERIQLGAVTDKIIVFVYAGSLPLYTTQTITPYIQKKRKRSFYTGAKTFPDPGMNDDTGKTFGIERKIAPSQPVTKSLGYLALKPGKIGKFVKDH